MTVVETAMALPHAFDEFTPAWFDRALSARFPGVKVAGFTRSGERIGTSASARFELEYAERGVGDPPPSVYIKGGFTEAQLNRYWVVLQKEALFYAEFASRVPMHIPRCFFAAVDDRRQGITLLEDLGLREVRFGAWGALTVDQVADLLEQLARMHGRFWLDEKMKAFTVGWEKPQRDFCNYIVRDKHWDHLVTRVYGDRLVEAVGRADLTREALKRMWALNDAAPYTLLHADTHGGNTFFETDGRCGLADFQLSFCGTPLYDMSWLIMSSLAVEDRRAEERNLIQAYLQAGRAAGMDLPDLDGAWLAYRQFAVNAVLNGACQPLEAGPIEMVNAAGFVTCAAAIDLDPLDALGVSRA